MITVPLRLKRGRTEVAYEFARRGPGQWAARKDGAETPYLINLKARTCTCQAGRHGRLCKHRKEAERLEQQMVTATTTATTTAPTPAPLWPQPIPILGLTGEYQSGKTWFGISVSPDPKRLRVYDFELSAAPYRSLGFDYVNVSELMAARYPRGPKPIDVWNWWLDDVSALEPGRYDVILADPVTDLERGLTDWVTANPAAFGHTAAQYQAMSGIMWGDLKDYWKLILSSRVATKCQTFAFVAHLGDEFKGSKATGKRTPKGKDTLVELATLYLWLARDKAADGSRPSVPSAEVLKSRLSHLGMGPDGPEIREALPPRLPVATPKAVRRYLLNPPDYANLKPEERAPERVMTADERLRLEVAKAEAERDAALAKGGAIPPSSPAAPVATQAQPPASPPAPAAFDRPAAIKAIEGLRDELGLGKNFGDNLQRAYGKPTLQALPDAELADLLRRLSAKRTPAAAPAA